MNEFVCRIKFTDFFTGSLIMNNVIFNFGGTFSNDGEWASHMLLNGCWWQVVQQTAVGGRIGCV